MKHFDRFYFKPLLCAGLLIGCNLIINSQEVNIQTISPEENQDLSISVIENPTDSIVEPQVDPHQVFESINNWDFPTPVINKTFAPWVFSGYRHLRRESPGFKAIEYLSDYDVITPQDTSSVVIDDILEDIAETPLLNADKISNEKEDFIDQSKDLVLSNPDVLNPDKLPKWLSDALTSYRIQDDFVYTYMIDNPSTIEYAYWDLPEPPVLLPDEVSFKSYIRKLKLPEIEVEKAVIPEEVIKKKHWLHTFNTLLQFSQAYVSPNWYQGGNNYLALLFNLNWNVQLNQVYHPNLLFQSNFSYKLALSSNPKGQLHKYTISEDLLQYNLNAGIKAYGHWFYSFNLLFKTQLLNNYEEDSMVRTASFLSPGDLNAGLGMTYSYQNKYKTFQFTATISPLSYNLKTCISDKVDHEQFNILPSHKVKNEIGSNAEFNMSWDITSNISYKTRLFLFTDYSYFLSDWENTLSFSINKFLSTQVYVHLRYDTSSESSTAWKKFMMREILSFGLSYTFSTKP